MKIMRYVGSSAEEAENKAKVELGLDVVILNTRKKRHPGFLGRFRKPIFETIAAVEEEKTEKQMQQANESLKTKTSEVAMHTVNKHLNEIQKRSYTNDYKTDSIKEFPDKHSKEDTFKNYDAMSEYYYENLIGNGVEFKIAKRLIHMTNSKIEQEYNGNYKMFPQQLRRNIETYLGKIEPIKINRKQNVIFFIGPTGVGKTTTLAKIAAQYAISNKEKVGLVTADTYRIAAVEQLRVYSEILDIPLQIIYDAKEIMDVVSKCNDKELILVDTAGRSHTNQDKIEELKDIVDSLENKEVYLVLSATTDFAVLKEIIKKYNFIDNYKIIFTKMDEVERYGVILNTRFYTNKALSYVTTGQNVPEDIKVINIKEISKQLIGER